MKFTSQIKQLTFDESHNNYSCTYRNRTRKFVLCLPQNTQNAPLILMLHGYGQSSAQMQTTTGFDKIACAQGFAVAYVDGAPDPEVKTSSTGWLYGNGKYAKDDLDFLEDLALFLQKKYSLGKNISAIGFSNGAFMCTKLATQKSRTFNSIVSVAGMMPKNVWEEWNKKSNHSHTSAFFQINGTKDDVVPMDFTGSSKYNQNPAMEKVIEYYRKGNKCPSSYTESKLSDASTMYSYGTKVAWVIIDGGYHSWPKPQFAQFEPEKVILEFFEKQ